LISGLIKNPAGQTLGYMSRAFSPPEGTAFVKGTIAAVLRWRKDDNEEAYRHLCKRDEWEVILPELVFDQVI
jgi:ATP-dependent DNA helicase RecQ